MHGFPSRFLVRVLATVLAVAGFASPAAAQTATLSTDVGNVPVAGSSRYAQSGGVYQLSGTGSGLGSSADAFHFAYYQSVLGDGQIVVRLASADPSAQAALVLRESLDAGAADAAVVVQNGSAQFVRRTATGNNAVADGTTGATVPCWLKLVRSGTTVSVFLSPDGQTWTSLGSDTVTTAGTSLYVGLAVSNGAAGAPTTVNASFDNVASTFLSSEGLLLWLRADVGVTQDATGNVSTWADQSGNGSDAYAAVGNQPQLITGALNGEPVIRFDGSSSFLQLPGGFNDFTQGITALVVTKPTSTASYSRLYDLANGPGQQNITFNRNGTGDGLQMFSQNVSFLLVSSTGFNVGQYQLVECEADPASQQANIYQNGVVTATGAANPILNTTRTSNFIARSNNGDPLYQGDIAEVLLFNRALTDADRQAWENYLNAKYNYDPVPTAPTQLVATALSGSQAALSWIDTFGNISDYLVEQQNADGTWSVIATLPAGTTNYTVTGLSPGAAYNFQVLAANRTGNSVAATASLTLPASAGGLPASGLRLWLRADSGTITDSGGLLSQWVDALGNGLSATQGSGNQPTVVSDTINGQPAVHFDGGSSFLYLPNSLFANVSSAEVYIVLRAADPVGGQRGLWRFTDRENDFYPENDHLCATFGTQTRYAPIGVATPLDQFNVYNVSAAPNAWTARMNGQTIYTSASNTVDFNAGTYLLGQTRDGQRFAGDIAEVLIFDHTLDTEDRLAVEQYLAGKYQLTSAPVAPSALSARALSPTQVSLTWQYPAENAATQFAVERALAGTDTYQVIATVDNGTSFLDNTASPGTAYSYEVVATDLAGNVSAASSAAQAATATSGAAFPTVGLRVWLEADAGATNGSLSSWIDQSGNGNDAQQGNLGNQPAVVTNTLNGQPVVHFNGNTFLQFPGSPFSGVTAAEVLVVLRAADPVGGQRGLWRFTDRENDFYPENDHLCATFGTQTRYAPISFSAPLDQFNVYNVSAAPNAWTARMNEQVLYTSASNTVDFSAAAYLLGQTRDGQCFNGDIAEVLIFDHALTDTDRLAVEEYLAGKYALATTPATPTALTVTPLSSTQVAVSWSESSPNVTGYTVERQNADGTWTAIATLNGTATQYVDSGLTAGQAYSYQVTAMNIWGSSPTTTVSGSTVASSPGVFPTSGLQLWFRADAGVTTDANGLVSAWADESGNAFNLSQGSAGNRPALVPNAYNGEPALHFDGSSTSLVSNSAFDLLAGSNDVSVIVVTNPGASQPTYADLFDYDHTSIGFVYEQNGNQLNDFSPGFVPVQLQAGELCVSSLVKGGTACQVYFDGLLVSNGGAPATLNPAPPRSFLIGNWFRGGRNYNGDIAELMIFNRALSDAERQTVESYLKDKYAVTGLPDAPSNLTATAISSTQANVLWTDSPEAAGYSLERKSATAPDSTYVQIAALPNGDIHAFLDSVLTPGAGYTYRLQAYNAAGYSGYSAAVSVTLPTAGTSVLPTDNLLLWLKPDAGTTADGSGLLSTWTDASGNGNNASAPVGNQPLLVTGALNGEPVVRFNGGNSFLQLPAGFSDFTQGMTALVVTRPASNASWQRFFDLGNGTPSDNLLLARNNTSNDLIYDGFVGGGLPTSVDAPNVLQTAAFQLLEVVHGVAGTAKLYNDASPVAQGSASPLNVVTRTSNFIGRSNWGDPLFQGDIAEVVMFNRALTDAERQAWESYLNAKYQCIPPPAAPAGLTVTALSATQVALSWAESALGLTGYLVERQNGDGIWSVIATLGAGATSYVDSGLAAGSPYAYRVTALGVTNNSTATPASGSTAASSPGTFPTTGLLLWLKPDAGVSADATTGLVSSWTDASGNGNNASAPAGNQPQLITGALNGEPVIRFDGSSSFLQLPGGFNDFTQGITALVVTKPTSTASYSRLYDLANGPGQQNITFNRNGTGDGLQMFSQNVSFLLVSSTGFNVGQYQLVECEADPASQQANIYQNGVVTATGAANPILNTTRTSNFIARSNNGDPLYQGDIAEVLLFNRALTDAERQTVETYLNGKYALTAPPNAPASLAGSAISSSQASLTWQPAAIGGVITNYSVERKTTQGGDDFVEVAAAVPGPSSAYLDENLSAATSYTYRVRAYNAYGYSDYSPETVVSIPAAGGTLPASLPGISDLALWLKLDAGVTKDDNDLVSAWTDLSGQGNDALQTNPSSRPQWVDGVMNGLPVLRFDGHTDSLATRLPVNTTNGNATILAVVRLPDANTRGAFVKNGFYAGFGFGVGSGTLDSTGNEAVGIFDYARWLPTGMPWGVGPVLAEMSLDAGGNPTLYRNGSPLGNLGSGGPVPSTGPTYIGGYQHDNARFLRGDIAEVVMFNRALTDAERQVWETYLNAKYQYNPPPPAPGALTVTPLSSTQVALSWSENFANVASYTVERQNPDGTWSVIATLGGSATSYIDSGLTPGVAYVYRLTATNAVGSSPTVTAGGSAATSSPGVFPFDGLSLWLKADAGISQDVNGLVSVWTDASGNGNNALAAPGQQPLWTGTAINGYPALQFSGSGQFLATAACAVPSNQNVTVLTVVSLPDANVAGTFVRNDGFSLGVGSGTLENRGNEAVGLYEYVRWIPTGQSWGTGAVLAGLTIDTAGQPTFYRNGASVASPAGAASNYTTGQTTIGGDPSWPARYFRGDIAEVLMFNRVLTDTEMATVQNYLNTKYAVVTTPAAPTGLSAVAISTTQANLFWMMPPQATGYSVERKDAGADDSAYAEVAVLSSGQLQAYLDGTLTPGASYSYRLRAYNLAGYSGYSAAVTLSMPANGTNSLPTDGLLLWLKPDAGVAADVNGLVSDWTDASGHGNDASASSGWQPHLVTDTLNGEPVIRFDGSSSYLQLPSGFSDFTQGITALVVTKPTSTGNYTRFFDIGNGQAQQNIVFCRYSTSDGLQFYGQDRFELDEFGVLALNQFQLVEAIQDPVSQQAITYKNGVSLGSTSAGTLSNITRTSNFIGRSNWPGNPVFQGDIAELLIFDHALTDADRQAWELYLNAKYNYDPVPPVPTQVVATPVSSTQAALGWLDTYQNISGYLVEQQNADGSWTTVATLAPTSNSYFVTGLAPGTAYTFQVIAVNRTGDSVAAQATLTTPASDVVSLPLDGLQLWLGADSGPVADANGNVSQWLDRSGNAHNTQPGRGQPTLVPGVLNGQPVVHFDGSQRQYVNLPNAFGDTPATAGEVVIVLRNTSPAGTSNGLGRFGTSDGGELYPGSDGGLYSDFGTNRQYGEGVAAPDLGTFNIYDLSSQPDLWQSWMDGVPLYQNTANTVSLFTNPTLGWYSWYSDYYFTGDVAEVLVYNRVLTPTERQSLNAYLTQKYQLLPAPAVPTGLSATQLSPTENLVTWNGMLDNALTSYVIERANRADGPFTAIATVVGSGTYLDDAVAAGQTYYYQVYAQNAGGQSAATAAVATLNPQTNGQGVPTTGLQMWLMGDGALESPVSNWHDYSGNGNDATQNGAGMRRPTVVSGALNGKPVLHFDAAQGQFLSLPGLSGDTPATAGELIIVLRNSASAGTNNGLGRFFGTSDGGELYPGGDGNLHSDFGTGTQYNEGAPAPDLSQFNIYDVSSQANLWQSWIDGVPLYQNTNNTPSFGGGSLGWYSWYSDYYFTGDVAEVLTYNRVLTPTERQSLNAYLTQKYQLLPAPATPAGLSVEQLSSTENLVTWSGAINDAPTSYIIQRSSSPDGPYTTIGTVTGSGTYLDTTAVAGQTYYYQVYAQNAGGQSAATAAVAAIDPQANGQGVPTTGLQTWLMGDGAWENPLSNWHDYSGNGNDATQNGAGTRRPTVVPGVLNGRPVVHFDASQGQYLNMPNPFGNTAPTAGELVVVLRNTAAPGTNNALGRFGVNSPADLYPGGDGNLYSSFGTDTQYGEGAPAPNLGQFNIYDVSSQASLWQSWMDGVPLYQNTNNTVNFSTGASLGWYSWYSDYYFTGDLAEVLTYNRVLTPTERQSLNAYLTQKYQLLPVPAVPTGLQVITLSQTQNLVSWDEVPGDDPVDYTILRASSPDGPYTAIATVVGGSGTYLDDTVLPGQTYYYQVYAQNGAGSSGTTAAVTVLNPQAEVQSLPLDGLQLWLMGDGVWESPLSYWHDYSGNGHDAAQNSGSAQQPTLVPGALNGKAVVHFDGTQGQYLNLPSAFGDTPTPVGELIIVVRNTAPAGTSNALGRFGASGPADLYPGGDGNVYSSFGTDTRYGEGVPVANEGVPAADLTQFKRL